MHRRTEKLGARLPPCVAASGPRRGLFKKASTYLAKIAVVLQEVPGKMLTFSQLMDRLTPLICQDRKSVENNVTVCLSSNKCFVKIPVVPASLEHRRKLNYWKLDPSQITEKMVRRHFKGILRLFPELVETDNRRPPEPRPAPRSAPRPAPRSPEPAASADVQIRCERKFSSPFSIESLLKRDGPRARASTASTCTHVLVGTNESLLLTASAGSSFIWLKPRGASADGAARPVGGMQVCSGSSLLVFMSQAPHVTSPPKHHITCHVPTFTQDALCF